MPPIFTCLPGSSNIFAAFPPVEVDYAYTQVINFKIYDSSVPASLSDATTEIGKVWAATLRTYLELPETGLIWWSLVHGEPSKAKLLIDWKTAAGREQFEANSQFQELSMAWQNKAITPVTNDTYLFPYSKFGRSGSFNSTCDTVQAFFTFRFAASPSTSEIEQLDTTFGQFYRTLLHSPGGVVATAGTVGWETSRMAYCVSVRYLNIETMQDFLESNSNIRRLVKVLKSYATGGTELEFLETRVYEDGWQGSVDQTRRPDPNGDRFIAEAQAIMRSIEAKTLSPR